MMINSSIEKVLNEYNGIDNFLNTASDKEIVEMLDLFLEYYMAFNQLAEAQQQLSKPTMIIPTQGNLIDLSPAGSISEFKYVDDSNEYTLDDLVVFTLSVAILAAAGLIAWWGLWA